MKQSWFFEKINKSDKCLAKLTKKKNPLGLRLPKGKFRIIKIEFDPLS